MKVTICGSLAFFDEMVDAKERLQRLGHEVQMPPTEVLGENGEAMSVQEFYRLRKVTLERDGWIWKRKAEAMRAHFEKVLWADCILVLNYTKRDVENYIGGNTLLEMGLAFHEQKPIFLWNPIPEQAHAEEVIAMQPIVINGDLSRIRSN